MRKLFFIVFVSAIFVLFAGSQANAETEWSDLAFFGGLTIKPAEGGRGQNIIFNIVNLGPDKVGNINLSTYVRIESLDGEMVWHNHRFFLYNWGDDCPYHPGMSHYGFVPENNEVKISISTAGDVCFEGPVLIRAWIDSDLEDSGIIKESDEDNNYLELLWIPGVGLGNTSVGISESNKLKYNLSQNYPNPFNPETRINYSIAKTGHVNLEVYNVTGQKIITLVDEEKSAGNYSVSFHANDLPSGVYFYHLEAGTYSETRKMFLNK
jgi:hypothetical protein